MKSSMLITFIGIVLVGCAGNSCVDGSDRTTKKITSQSLAKQQGKTVTFQARIAKVAEQHPTGLFDDIDPVSGVLIRKYETYVDLQPGDSQIVLVSSQPLSCPDLIEVEGIVDLVNLNGETGTKASYSRPWIMVLKAWCR